MEGTDSADGLNASDTVHSPPKTRDRQGKRTKGSRGGPRPASENASESEGDEPSSPTVSGNLMLDEYYRKQGVCAECTWPQVYARLKTPLPRSLRLNLSVPLSQYAWAALRAQGVQLQMLPVLPHMAAVGFVPEGSAGSLPKNLLELIISMNKTGEVSRQEVVSMLPPALLKVSAVHNVLDMCCAPGSKTSQLLDMMHSALKPHELPSGVLIANDADRSRVHKVLQRIRAQPCSTLVLTQCDARSFPALRLVANTAAADAVSADASHMCLDNSAVDNGDVGKPSQPDTSYKIRFDRILADVPCSGDGTLRKNRSMWASWDVSTAMALHSKQIDILQRGLELLSVGGLLMYSTCSLNPIEDEAVVGAALTMFGNQIELIEMDKLDGVPFHHGLGSWYVPDANYNENGMSYSSTDEVPPLQLGGRIRSTMFPPADSSIRAMLRLSARVLPTDDFNAGGFFMAMFRRNLSGDEPSKLRPSSKSSTAPVQQPPKPTSTSEYAVLSWAVSDKAVVKLNNYIATVMGPGVGKYAGLIKIRYDIDKTTYHLKADEIRELSATERQQLDARMEEESKLKQQKIDGRIRERARQSTKQKSNPQAGVTADGEMPVQAPTATRQAQNHGVCILRPLQQKAIERLVEFYGLIVDVESATAAALPRFPIESLRTSILTKNSLFVCSDTSAHLRYRRNCRVVSAGMPVFQFIPAEERKTWPVRTELTADGHPRSLGCFWRPSYEGAMLLAGCATRRKLTLTPAVMSPIDALPDPHRCPTQMSVGLWFGCMVQMAAIGC